MKIHSPNSVLASGPAFSLDVTIPNANLPVYILGYSVRSDDNSTVSNTHLVSMKPSTATTRVLQLQATLSLTHDSPEYTIVYTFDPYDEMYQAYASSIVYAPYPSGTFLLSISGENGSSVGYNVSDYWTYVRLNATQLQLTFQPSLGMIPWENGKSIELTYDMTL